MSTARRAVLLRVGLLVALVGAFLGAAPSFAFRGTLVAVAPKMNTMLNQDTASVYSNEKIFFTPRRAKVPRDFGGKHPEAIFTALVAGIATYLMSTLQGLLQRQLWVPPFGAVTLIFAADAVAAAKEGKTMCFKTMWQKAWQACIGVAGACFLTVLLARLLGNTPSVLRAVAMFVAALSMLANPQSGYFPPAGALCALYVEKSVSMGKAMLPQQPGSDPSVLRSKLKTPALITNLKLATTQAQLPVSALPGAQIQVGEPQVGTKEHPLQALVEPPSFWSQWWPLLIALTFVPGFFRAAPADRDRGCGVPGEVSF
ncbi:E3 ubiquitin-protein ligase HERC2 [Durusdinium trenchii]|uniref:E3 ubiquitin-protein ligase HERC2 n=1 Tax=Durusdinium trenchii TaxID=1381693 RepID=A0ABP0NXL5_9DINO